MLSYDIPHHAPWGWRVSLYTWTKNIGAGAFMVPVLLALTGFLSWGDAVSRWAAPGVALAFLGATGALLIWDLKHPLRFYLIFTRHHWRSWLVRGAFILGGFGAVVTLYALAELAGLAGLSGLVPRVLGWIGLPLALGTAVYTAYLFAQAKARDLWQSPLLAPHLAVQSLVAGGAVTVLAAGLLSPDRGVRAAEVLLAAASAAHVLFVASETTIGHVTEHAHLASEAMTRGRYARYFWPGLAMVAAAIAAPWAGPVVAVLALAGLLAHEHAYVQAGQSVPLA